MMYNRVNASIFIFLATVKRVDDLYFCSRILFSGKKVRQNYDDYFFFAREFFC